MKVHKRRLKLMSYIAWFLQKHLFRSHKSRYTIQHGQLDYSTLFKFLSRKIEFSKESKRKNVIDIEDKYLSTLLFKSAKVSCKLLTTAKRIQKSLLRPAIHKFMDPGTIGLDSHT